MQIKPKVKFFYHILDLKKDKEPIHTCHYCGHASESVNKVESMHLGGAPEGNVYYFICDNVEDCISRPHDNEAVFNVEDVR